MYYPNSFAFRCFSGSYMFVKHGQDPFMIGTSPYGFQITQQQQQQPRIQIKHIQQQPQLSIVQYPVRVVTK